jgi:S-formylglutathione hydrolase FrmB
MTRSRSFACLLLLAAAAAHADPFEILVTLHPALMPAQSGRLLVFVQRLGPDEKPDDEVDLDLTSKDVSSVAAREVWKLEANRYVMVDGEKDVYPAPLSTLPPGRYEVQAVLDRNHDYNYDGRGAGDLISEVDTFTLPGPLPTLSLVRAVPEEDEAAQLAGIPAERRAVIAAWLPKLKPINFKSKLMSAFQRAPAYVREPTYIRGWVALPPGYDGKRRFPTSYSFAGFSSNLLTVKRSAATMMALMASGKAPPMIWIYLDYAVPTGTHEFADSDSNGPWGAALTTELIPALEKEYRIEDKPAARFVTGHSSGGWAALWLQVKYPQLFGGSWPVSPDASDFRELFGSDIYAPDANFYFDANGKPLPAGRPDENGVVVTVEAFARSEAVLGDYGGQFSTYEYIYSPPAMHSGFPMKLYDRATGKIDPQVAAYWGDHYDIGRMIVRDWAALKPHLDGKIHLTVGAADTWYLDKAAMKLEEAMKSVGAKTDFRYLPGKGHNDVYSRPGDRSALLEDIAWEMYRASGAEVSGAGKGKSGERDPSSSSTN